MNPALERHREQFEADPTRVPAFEALEEHYFVDGDWDALVALYDARLGAPDLQAKPAVRARLLFRLGQVLEERCGRPDDALARYEEAARLAPDFQPALRSLRALYTARERWEMVLQVGELEARTPMRPVERAAFHVEMAEIWLERLGDAAQALELLDRALEDDVRSAAALRGRGRALAALDRTGEATDCFERLLTTTAAGAEQAPVLLEMARLADQSDAERALDLYARALTLDDSDVELLEAYAAAARRAERWETLGALAERRFSAAPGASRRAEVALESASVLLEELGDAAGARGWLERAAELAPEDVRIALALADASALLGDAIGQMAALERALELDAERVPLEALIDLGEAQASSGETGRAVDTLRRALERAPESDEVLDALVEAHRSHGSHDELVDLLETRAAKLTGRARAEVLAQIGAVHERHGDDAESASDALRRAFDTDPSTPGVAVTLERLYQKAEAWEDLRRVLEVAQTSTPVDERAPLLASLGELYVGPLAELDGAPERARHAFEAALDLDPAAERALRGLALLAESSGDEETLLAAWGREVEATPDAERRLELSRQLCRRHEARGELDEAARFAERVLEDRPEDDETLELCVRLAERRDDSDALRSALVRLAPRRVGTARAEIEKRLAALFSDADLPGEAADHLQHACEASPDDLELLRSLAEHLRRAGRLPERARALRTLAERETPPERAGVLAELARLLCDDLEDPDAAVVVLWRLVEDPDAPEDVDERLESALERTRRFEELAQRLAERRQTLEDDSPEAMELDLRRAGVLRTHLGQFEQAAPLYRAAYERYERDDPRGIVPLDGVEACARGAGDDETLAWVLAERARRADDGDEWASVQLERAALLEQRLGRLDEARRVYADLVEAGGDSARQADPHLIRLLERQGAWEPLRERLEARAAEAEDGEALETRERLVEICLRLGDPEGAAEHLEAAATRSPERLELFERLAELHEKAGRREAALQALDTALETPREPPGEVALRCRAARLAEEIEDADAARRHLERVLELEPGHADAVALLTDHHRREGRTAELVELLATRVELIETAPVPDRAAAGALRVQIAQLQHQVLCDAEAAIATLEPAVNAALGDPTGNTLAEAATPLADLLERTGREEAVLALAKRMVDSCRDSDARADWSARLGTALAARGERDAAVAAWRDVLAWRPGDAAAGEALCELHREAGDGEALVRLLEARLPGLAGTDEVPVRSELAQVMSALGRPEEALVHLRRVLEVDPGHADARQRALELAETLGSPDALLELLDGALLDCTSDREQRANLLLRRGQVLAGPLERSDEAVACFREAAVLAPDDPKVRAALLAILEQVGDWRAHLDELHIEVQRTSGGERLALLERGTRIASEHLSPDAALPWLERLRAERPQDAEVVARVADVHRRAGRPEALLRSLEAQVELVRDGAARRRLQLEIAGVLERDLDSAPRAVAALEKAAAEDATSDEVLAELDRHYRAAGRVRDRAEILERRLQTAPPDARAALQRTLADLYRGPLCEPGRAVDHLRVALEGREGARPEILQSLGQTLLATGRTAAWAEVAEAELGALDGQDPVFAERRRELHRTLADAYGRRLGEPDAALRHLRALVDAPAPDADDELAASERDAAEVALLAALRRYGTHTELAARLAARLERRPDASGWIELGRLREEKLHAPSGAADAYASALEAEPDCLDALRGLRRTAERRGDFEAMADALEREIAARGDAPAAERAALQRALGEVAWRRLGSTTRASRAFASALEAMPGDLAAVRALESLCEAMEDWRGAADFYGSEIDLLGDADPARRRAVHLQLADLACSRLEDGGRAVAALREADGLEPLEPPRLRLLTHLLRECGDLDACAVELTRWCEDPRSGAAAADHLELAELLESLGRHEESLARVDRGIASDADDADLWRARGRLLESLQRPGEAAEAWSRCAAVSRDAEGASCLVRAAELLEKPEPERALEWLRQATERDPASAAAHAGRARLAEHLSHAEEAEAAAGQTLDLATARDSLEPEVLLATALVGARAAQARGDLEAAARFATTARAVEPDSLDALAVEGCVLYAMGEIEGARRALERRVEADGDEPYPERVEHLSLLGSALEAAGELDAALIRYSEALDLDAGCDDARSGIVRVHERAGRLDDALTARLAWAEVAAPEIRARQLVRVAELTLARDADEGAAEGHLLRALEADPASADAHLLLTTRLAESDRLDEALELATAGLGHASDGDIRARLATLQARMLEQRGERRAAADAWGLAAESDPRATGAALAQARILRALGEWGAAADALTRFADAHPEAATEELAAVHFQRGRLLAGPLERVEEGLDAYRAALAANPRFRDAHAALAGLLVHRRDDWDEALARHRDLLEIRPGDPVFLRGVLRIAEGRGKADSVSHGHAILDALGAAAPGERRAAPEAISLRLGGQARMENPVWECARSLATSAAEEIGRALDAPAEATSEVEGNDPQVRFRAEALAAEGALAAPGLVPLDDEAVAEVLRIVAELATDAEQVHGDGPRVNRLSAELGRRARRRLRRELGSIEPAEIADIDWSAWRSDLRTLAHLEALDRLGGDLRTALIALISREGDGVAEDPGADGDLSAVLDASPAAVALLRRVVLAWLDDV